MINPTKKIFSSMTLQESIFPAVRILIAILFLVSLILSLRFIYEIINEALIAKPAVSQKQFFDIERFKKIGPKWGMAIEEAVSTETPIPSQTPTPTLQLNSFYEIETFEQGPGSTDEWNLRNNVHPDVTSVTAYTGKYSLHMSLSYGRDFENSNFFKANNFKPGQDTSGYNTKDYPFMCMAYKIPLDTKNNMLIYITGIGWRSITMTQCENPTTYPKVATWNPLFTDNTWHYSCINLDSQLDTFLGTGPHTISAVVWNPGGGCPDVKGEFWIDDFAIAKNTVPDPKK